MKSFVFITAEGYTFQPDSIAIEPDIENCQIIGFACGDSEQQAFTNLVKQNPFLLETTFDELICLELKHENYFDNRVYFHINDLRSNPKYCRPDAAG